MIRFIVALTTVVAVILLAVLIVVYIVIPHPVKDEMTVEEFEPYREDFVLVNDYILENTDLLLEGEEGNVVIVEEDGHCVELHSDHEDADVPDDVLQALNNINEYFGEDDFHLIGVSDSQIRYWGEGKIAVVYQRDGEAPRYYEHKDDGIWDYSIYILEQDWYQLYNGTHIR